MASRKKQLSQGEWATVIKAQDQASKMLLKEEEDLMFFNTKENYGLVYAILVT